MATLPTSSLIDRYNGAMLGSFVAAAGDPRAGNRYPFLRVRIQEYLREIGVDCELPQGHADFMAEHETISRQIWLELQPLSQELWDFCLLGSMAYFSLPEPSDEYWSDAELVEDMKRLSIERLCHYGIGAATFQHFLESFSGLDAPTPFDDRLSSVLRLIRECLLPIAEENNTAFVSMPFQQPFIDRFSTFYQPLLANLGYRRRGEDGIDGCRTRWLRVAF